MTNEHVELKEETKARLDKYVEERGVPSSFNMRNS